MSSKKSLPYKVDQEYDIINILKHRHEIPYHSRPFMWEPVEGKGFVKHIVREALAAWHADECYWLGIVILYTGGDVPAVSDAQHRLTVCFLMILYLAEQLGAEEPLAWISSYGGSSILRAKVPAEDQVVLDTHDWKRFPNIVSCYEHDFEALGNLLNGKKHDETTPPSFIYSAAAEVREVIHAALGDDADAAREFLMFLHNDVKILRIVITDWRFTIRVFNSFNKIKVTVPPSYLLKNRITELIGEEHSAAVHEAFNTVPAKSKEYEQTVHLLTTLMVGAYLKIKEYDATVSTLALGDDPLAAFKQIVADYKKVSSLLEASPYYRILQGMVSGYEVRNLCLIPLSYKAIKAGQMDVPGTLCRVLVAYGIRSGRTISFNAMKFQEQLIKLVTEVLNEEKGPQEALCAMIGLLRGWLGEDAKNQVVTAKLVSEYWERSDFKRARAALLYLVTLTDTHESRLDHDAVQIDHVYPKTPSKSCPPLANLMLRHRIGNFTPFVGKNTSDGEMKGNMSLGNKSFALKQPYYAKSNIAITRELATYTTFADAEIEARSVKIATRLAELTAADLKLPL
jgi:hypothetical protein